MESNFGHRVLLFRQHKGLSQTDFGNKCKPPIKQSTVGKMELGTDSKQSAAASILAGFPDLNPDWLLLGNGSMFRGGVDVETKEHYKKVWNADVTGQDEPAFSEPAPTYGEDTGGVTTTAADPRKENEVLRRENARLMAKIQKLENRVEQLINIADHAATSGKKAEGNQHAPSNALGKSKRVVRRRRKDDNLVPFRPAPTEVETPLAAAS